MSRLLIFWGLFIFTSCQPKIEFESQQDDTKLVLWCFLHPDSVITASLTKTIPAFSNESNKKVTDGTVVIYENNNILDTLHNDGTDIYTSSKGLRPKIGSIYAIKAHKIGYKTIETVNDTMPIKPVIKSWSTIDSFTYSPYTLNGNKKGLLAYIHLTINTRSNFPIYGVSRMKVINLPYGDYFSSAPAPFCPIKGGVSARGFIYNYQDCSHNQSEMNIYVNNVYPEYFRKAKLRFRLCATTYQYQEFYKAYNKFVNDFSGSNDIGFDLYWTPVTFPEYIKNGYGFFGCYNTSDELEVHF